MTKLTPEQFAIVVREIETMLADDDLDEAWRVIKMFADGRFNVRLAELPERLQKAFADLGSERRRRYAELLGQIGLVAGSTFDITEIGSLKFGARTFPLVRLVTKPALSP